MDHLFSVRNTSLFSAQHSRRLPSTIVPNGARGQKRSQCDNVPLSTPRYTKAQEDLSSKRLRPPTPGECAAVKKAAARRRRLGKKVQSGSFSSLLEYEAPFKCICLNLVTHRSMRLPPSPSSHYRSTFQIRWSRKLALRGK